MNEKYETVDFIKYICSILVIMIHTSPGLPYSTLLNFAFINIIGRIAVPFFFVASGYFLSKNIQQKGKMYFREYMKSLIKIYLLWSFIYLPFGIFWIYENIEISLYLYPFVLCIALIYIGTYYHLWYIPALIFAFLMIRCLEKRLTFRYILSIAFILFSIGSIETYYGFIQQTSFLPIVDYYFMVFQTTRNGLFFGLFFVALGYYLAKEHKKVELSKAKRRSIFFFLGIIIEAILLYHTNNKDMNFLFMTIPFTYYFFKYALQVQISWKLNFTKLKVYSSYYYFSHAIFLVFIPIFLKLIGKSIYYQTSGLFRFLSVLLCTHFLSAYLYKRKNLKEVLN